MTSASIYSFVAWLASFLVYVCYIMWAFLPTDWLHSLGITYYPSRYYAVALPSYVLVTYLLSGMMYISYNMMNTLSPENLHSIQDDIGVNRNTRLAPLTFIKVDIKEGIPDIGDIDPIQYSKILKY